MDTIREYMKKFSGLMLHIKDMSEEDKLFDFLEGLKLWARTELQRQRVQDMATAQTATECLTDYTTESTQPKKTQPNAPSSSNSGKKPRKPGQSKSGGADKRPTESSSSTKSAGSSNTMGTLSCWLYNGKKGLPNARTSPS